MILDMFFRNIDFSRIPLYTVSGDRMLNIIDYLKWRGDVSLTVLPFNEADNLVLSMVSFLDLDGIVPERFACVQPTLREAVAMHVQIHGSAYHFGELIPPQTLQIMTAAAKSVRFGQIHLCAYKTVLSSEPPCQLTALTYLLPDETLYVAFRGTDDTICGWVENLQLCLPEHSKGEWEAVDYLNFVSSQHYGKIRLGGHSKGGRFAVFAAANVPAEVQRRILNVWSNDGPGFLPDFYETPGYTAIRSKAMTLIPQSSIVGTLLQRDEARCAIIRSDENGIQQHNPLSWSALPSGFERLKSRSFIGRQVDEKLNQWIFALSVDERRKIVDILTELAYSTGANTLTEMNEKKLHATVHLINALKELDGENRKMLLILIRRFFVPRNPNERR